MPKTDMPVTGSFQSNRLQSSSIEKRKKKAFSQGMQHGYRRDCEKIEAYDCCVSLIWDDGFMTTIAFN